MTTASMDIGAGTPIWLTVPEAAMRARCGPKVVYRAARTGQLRAAKIGGRGELRFRAEWVDEWLESTAQPREIARYAPK
jgi:excisionase family DNA binding protein